MVILRTILEIYTKNVTRLCIITTNWQNKSTLYQKEKQFLRFPKSSSPVGSVVKNLSANAGTTSLIPIQEDPTWLRATKPMYYNYWVYALEPMSHNYWRPHTQSTYATTKKPPQWEAPALHLKKIPCSNEEPVKPKTERKKIFQKSKYLPKEKRWVTGSCMDLVSFLKNSQSTTNWNIKHWFIRKK